MIRLKEILGPLGPVYAALRDVDVKIFDLLFKRRDHSSKPIQKQDYRFLAPGEKRRVEEAKSCFR